MTSSPPLHWHSACGTYDVRISRGCFRAMKSMARDHMPNEVGTSLVGTYSDDGRRATVNGIAPLPSDSRSTRTTFQRGINGLFQFFNTIFSRYRGRRHYVGEWHSHPNAAPIASGTDDANQFAIANDASTDCPEAILVIIGGDGNDNVSLQMYVYSRTRGKIVLIGA